MLATQMTKNRQRETLDLRLNSVNFCFHSGSHPEQFNYIIKITPPQESLTFADIVGVKMKGFFFLVFVCRMPYVIPISWKRKVRHSNPKHASGKVHPLVAVIAKMDYHTTS